MAELDEKINNYSENKKRHSFLEEYEELEMYKIVQEKRFSIYKDNTPDISNAIITIYPEYILKTDVSDNEIINKNYTNLIKSSVLDLLSLYLKGQKMLFIEAKTICETKLNWIMLPAIFISAACTVLNYALKDYAYGTLIMSGLNAGNSFLLALISFLKLDAKVQAHTTTSNKYEKLELYCEGKANRFMYNDNNDNIANILDDIEMKTNDINESNKFILPEIVRHDYKDMYFTNIFSYVRDLRREEMIIIEKYKSSINRLNKLYECANVLISNRNKLLFKQTLNDENDKLYITEVDNKLKDMQKQIILAEKTTNDRYIDLMQYKGNYNRLKETFKKIIDDNIMAQRSCCYCFSCVCRTPCKGDN
jgi:hypothetical protein